MASLRDQFEHFYAPDEDAEKRAIQTGPRYARAVK
jgi:hypothetical protein